ncbi:MAG TPA: alpha-amylase family glycosyl hydrolase [Chloroflexia bacterium]|nr:alpha-amylase family glycosyl hydrolase [Chloroflexia bacterium]
MSADQYLWWQSGVIYQIYPRSFKDNSGDGIGDLAGIIGQLDYLNWLGIDAIWLSPFYPSPMADFGYDITNFTDVDPVFGNLRDFDRMVKEAHSRNIKVIVDFVPNHTSDEHPWFKEASASRSSPKHDWYIWADPGPGGEPPNNWMSHFGGSLNGSAWEYNVELNQYYLHTFHFKQPDLNWRNNEVRQAMYGVMRFWLNRGVDGFRIDVMPFLIKDDQLRDNPFNPDWKPGDAVHHKLIRVYSEDRPETHEIVQEMRCIAEEYSERVLIGEIYLPYPRLVRYYGENLNETHLPFNFELILLKEWQAAKVCELVNTYEATLPAGAWPNWVLGNHDNSRPATRLGEAQTRIAQMLLLTLRGTPTFYYGDEIGMTDVPIPPELAFDPQEKSSPGHGRDPARTPMQWDSSPNAGFCPPGVKPWLPVSNDYAHINVAVEQDAPYSVLNLVHELVALRRASPALSTGSYSAVESGTENSFCYLRESDGQRFLIALNFSDRDVPLSLSQFVQGTIVLSTLLDRRGGVNLASFNLRGNEGLLILLQG